MYVLPPIPASTDMSSRLFPENEILILMSVLARRMDQECWKEVWKRSRLRRWSDGRRGCCQGGFGTMMDRG